MVKSISEFRKIDGLNSVYSAGNRKLRCCAIQLKTGGLCLFSPVPGLGPEAITSLANLGDVEFLLAPNHYHNRGLAEYQRAFPKASVCAPPKAHPRLGKVTGLQFADLNPLQATLPDNIHLVFPQGLKTGEVWIKVLDTKHRAWLVVDAFCGVKGEPDILGTFPKFGIRESIRYVAWLEQQIQEDTPTMIVPCHGNMINSVHLAKSLRLLIETRL